jgi:hypothetical protein
MFLTIKTDDRWEKIQRNAHSIPGFEQIDRYQPSKQVSFRMGVS